MKAILDPFSGEKLESEASVLVGFPTPRGKINLCVNQSTAQRLAVEGVEAFSQAHSPRDEGESFIGSYFGQSDVGKVTSDFVREALDSLRDMPFRDQVSVSSLWRSQCRP